MIETKTTNYEPFLIEVTGTDAPFEDGPITSVKESDTGWEVTHDGWTIFVPNMPIQQYGRVLRPAIVPKVGDRLRLYGSFGHPVQGIQINEDVVFYRDQEQREASRRRWLEDHEAQKARSFTLRQGELDAEFDALPPFFRRRIERFRDENPDFRKDSEGYEMFACTEAVKIAYALEPTIPVPSEESIAAAVKEFYDKPWDEQKRIVPDLGEGHSGNTFGGACSLAVAYLRHRAGDVVSV